MQGRPNAAVPAWAESSQSSQKRNCAVYTSVLWITSLHERRFPAQMRTSCRNILVFFALSMTVLAVPALSQQKAQESTPKYRDPSLAIDDRVADLRARMTL